MVVAIVVVVVDVDVDADVDVDGFGLVVVGAVVGAAVGCGRVGSSGAELGLGDPPEDAPVPETGVTPPPSASTRVPPATVGLTPGPLVVGAALPSVVTGPAWSAGTGTVVLEGVTRSAPVSASHPGPQRSR